MPRSVLFNNVRLVRAGGATKVDHSQYEVMSISGAGIIGLIGEAAAGDPGVAYVVRSPAEGIALFKKGALADAMNAVFSPSNDPAIAGRPTNVICVKVNQSVKAKLDLYSTSGTVKEAVVTAVENGIYGNAINFKLLTSGAGKQVTIQRNSSAGVVTETSPMICATPEFTLIYSGSGGSDATVTITATKLTTAVTGAATQNLDLTLADYDSLYDLISAINATGNYTAAAVTLNTYVVPTSALDLISAVNIFTSANISASFYRLMEWINTNSSLVTIAKATGAGEGLLMPENTGSAGSNLSGGVRGISANSDWQTGFDLLKTLRVNQVVPLISADLSAEGNGSTAALATVLSQFASHLQWCNSTAGKKERQGFVGAAGTKTQLLAMSAGLQSPHICLFGEKHLLPNANGDLAYLPEWSAAVLAAACRVGASAISEPLTHKNVKSTALTRDASWSPEVDGDDMILGGVCFCFLSETGVKFDRVTTTYTAKDNDSLTQESMIQVWKYLSYDERSQLEALFTGNRALPARIEAIAEAIGSICEQYLINGHIVPSVINGATVPAYRDITVSSNGGAVTTSVAVSIVPGIDFILNNIIVTPASNVA